MSEPRSEPISGVGSRRYLEGIREAYAEWIGRWKWTAMLTLTFSDRDGEQPGMQRSARAARRFADRAQALGLRVILVEERGTWGGRIHWHGVLDAGSTEDRDKHLGGLGISSLMGEWETREGFTQLSVLRSQDAGVRYVTKYLTKGDGRMVTSMDSGAVA